MGNKRQSVFSVLSTYSPQPGLNPRENYSTELLAWYINQVIPFRQRYCSELLRLAFRDMKISDMNCSAEAETQVPAKDNHGIIDMVITTDYQIKDQYIAFICEHKINSGLRENQISNYKSSAPDTPGRTTCKKSVLLTKSVSQHTQEADVKITWSFIYRMVASMLESGDTYTEREKFLLSELETFLKEGDFGVINPINQNAIKEYFSVKEFMDSIKSMFKNLGCINWEDRIDNISHLYNEKEVTPSVNDKIRWGRYGIDFFKEWNPGLFAGVIFDGKDHKLAPLHEEKGPDFVVLLEAIKDTETYNKICRSSWLDELKTRLKISHEPFDEFVESPKNEYRLAILRKPLFDIIGNTNSAEDQESELAEYIEKGIRLFLNETK